jgi:hypothetical protein
VVDGGYGGGAVVVDCRCTVDGVPVRSVSQCKKVHRLAVRGRGYAFAMGTGVAAYITMSGGGYATGGGYVVEGGSTKRKHKHGYGNGYVAAGGGYGGGYATGGGYVVHGGMGASGVNCYCE